MLTVDPEERCPRSTNVTQLIDGVPRQIVLLVRLQGDSTTAENMSGKASRGSYIPAREGIFAVNFALD